jgi:hypothetical protein
VDLGLGDVWEYRDLLHFLVWRDVKIRDREIFLRGFALTWKTLSARRHISSSSLLEL